MYNLPNILTISRIIVIPVIFLSIYIHSYFWSLLAAILFIVAAITDYFDGYLARARHQTSAFGRLLDPIADKLLVVSALLIIVANDLVDEISYIPVVIIMCREVLVSGLREFLAEFKVGMPVTKLAKWKTACQMTALAMILVGGIFRFPGEVLLWIAGILTFITGYQYFDKGLSYVKQMEKEKKAEAKAQKTEKATKTVKENSAAKSSVKSTKAKENAKKKAKKAPTKKGSKK